MEDVFWLILGYNAHNMFWNELKSKNWIDWVKILVAVDIAIRGFGLIINIEPLSLNFFVAYLLGPFGFVSRLFFGMMYVFVAVLIFKRIFPQKLANEEHVEAKRMDEEIADTAQIVKKESKKLAKRAEKLIEKAQNKIDAFIERGEQGLKKGKKDATDEIKKLINE
jgi:hypothetical protein